jgi:hypothetical protein
VKMRMIEVWEAQETIERAVNRRDHHFPRVEAQAGRIPMPLNDSNKGKRNSQRMRSGDYADASP